MILTTIDEMSGGEFVIVEAVWENGNSFMKSVPFSVHKSVRREKFPKEEDWIAYLKRMAKAVIARCGDARNPFPQELVEGAS